MRRWIIANLSTLAAVGLTASASLAQPAEVVELPLNGFYCAGADEATSCKKMISRLEADNRKAWKGDYQGQRNVAFCLSDGCGNMVLPNRSLGCAWRIVIIASGSPKVDTTDIGNLKVYCGKLDAAERSAAQAQAATLFRTIYKREIGPVAW
ncbi:Uncharacterised protein [Starkeya nomas]|uniref:Uncharacterized protein n=1 Tax=Starkeya nomas TaxID=2666134 RepID=A0A5S9NBM9_9HYPH|nr:hypothetical protein [Starkeya nomas]CAA0087591.1 Uncharacterised protein [Starkeya nomas]